MQQKYRVFPEKKLLLCDWVAVLFGSADSLAVEMIFSTNAPMRRHWLGWLGSPGDSRAWSGGNLGTGLGFAFDPKHGRQPLENLKEGGNKVC